MTPQEAKTRQQAETPQQVERPKSWVARLGGGHRMTGPLGTCGPVVRWALTAGTSLSGVQAPALPIDRWEAELPMLVVEGLAPFIVGRLPATVSDSKVGEALRTATFRATATTSLATQTALPVLRSLERDGVPFAVIKGPAVRRWHSHPYQRCFSDVDIMVQPADFRRALSSADRMGFRPPEWPGLARRSFALTVMEGINLHASTGGNVDVHHHAAPWVFASALTASSVIETADHLEGGGFDFPCSSAEAAVVISALHVINDLWKGRLGLQSWRDLLIIGEVLGRDGLNEAFGRYESSWLLGLLGDALDEVVPQSALVGAGSDHIGATPWKIRLRLRALGWDGPSLLTTQRFVWTARLPATHALLFLAGSIVPSSQYVTERDGGYLRYWERCLKESWGAFRGADARAVPPKPLRLEGKGS